MIEWFMVAVAAIALVLGALIISIEEDTHERKYGNGKESGFGQDKQG